MSGGSRRGGYVSHRGQSGARGYSHRALNFVTKLRLVGAQQGLNNELGGEEVDERKVREKKKKGKLQGIAEAASRGSLRSHPGA
jgi:hypothetical protein